MEDNSRWDKVFAAASWVIVAALLFGAVAIWFNTPSGNGPVAQLLGVVGSQYFYSVLYGGEALVLGYSKARKKKTLRKNTLLVIYLTGFFTSMLVILIGGFQLAVLDNLTLATLAAGCWLWWKFKTEYISPKHFQEVTQTLRDDLPPAR